MYLYDSYEMRWHRAQNTVTLLREELLQTKAALRKLVEAAREAETAISKSLEGRAYDIFPAMELVQGRLLVHNAIAEAERLLNP